MSKLTDCSRQVLAIFFVFISTVAHSENPYRQEIEQTVEGLRSQRANAGLAIAVLRANELLHIGLHGTADISSGRQLSERSLFMIGSTTKAMTATLAAIAVANGAMQWDTQVRSLIPSFSLLDPEASEKATVADLLSHRTGLPRHDYAWLSQPMNSEGYVQLMSKLEPSAPFRTKFQYQNLMYMTAGMMTGNALQSVWADELELKIFAPLNMTESRSLSSKLRSTDDVAMPHGSSGETIVRIPARNIDAVGPAGSVHSSIMDMAKWLQFNLNAARRTGVNSLLSDENMSEVFRPQIEVRSSSGIPEFGRADYGLGWFISSFRGQRLISHDGGIDGYLSSVLFFPEKDLGIVILTNGGNLLPGIVAYSVADLFLNEGASQVNWLEKIDPSKDPEPFPENVTFATELEKIMGSYHHPAYGTLRVDIAQVGGENYLALELNQGIKLSLVPWIDGERWVFDYSGFLVYFDFNQNGSTTSVSVKFEPELPPIRFAAVED